MYMYTYACVHVHMYIYCRYIVNMYMYMGVHVVHAGQYPWIPGYTGSAVTWGSGSRSSGDGPLEWRHTHLTQTGVEYPKLRYTTCTYIQ